MKHIIFLFCICVANFSYSCTFMRTSDTRNATVNGFISSNIVVMAIAIKLEKHSYIKVPFRSEIMGSEKVTWLVLYAWKGDLPPSSVIVTDTPDMSSACYATFYSYSPLRILYLKNIINDDLHLTDIGGESELIEEQIQTLNILDSTSKPYISLDKQYPPARPTHPQLISNPSMFIQHISPVKHGEGEIGYKANIDKEGKVTDVIITMISASESETLSAETIKLVKKAKFKPATLKGVPIPSTYDGRMYWEDQR